MGVIDKVLGGPGAVAALWPALTGVIAPSADEVGGTAETDACS